MEFTTIREVNILNNISHPNIIKLRSVWSENNRKICLKMDYYDIDLSRIIDPKKIELSIEDIKYIMYCILDSVGCLHDNFFLHRDVKPSNFVLNTKGDIVLIDFGLARKFASPDKELTKNVITRWYKPPEILYGAKFYSDKVDVWSCGCIFAELFLGETLFPGTSDIDQLSKIFGIRGTPNSFNWPDVTKLPYYFAFEERQELELKKILLKASDECIELINKMLQIDPNKRPSIKEIISSPFFDKKLEKRDDFGVKISNFLS